MKKVNIILASKSPRRKAILKQIGVNFTAIESNFEENKLMSDSATSKVRQLVIENAEGKAKNVASKIQEGIVLGADTLVLFNGKIIGKPKDKEDALRILKMLNGKMHLVFSGIALLRKDNKKFSLLTDSQVSKVYFRKLQEEEIKEYIEIQKPLDQAGGYGAQDRGAILIERIEGDYSNVVGLPIAKLLNLAKKMRIKLV